jgi:two-component sensor histidine kinase
MQADGGTSETARRLDELQSELARIQRIGKIGGLEVDLRNGGFVNTRSPGYLAVHGLPPVAANESHEAWLQRIHPDDRDRMEHHFVNAVRGAVTDYVAEYRVVRPSDGDIRWVYAKGQIERDAGGEPIRFVGAHLDITDRKTSEEQTALIARELSHRIKNLIAVVQGITRMMARRRPEADGFVHDLLERLGALDAANDIIRERHLGENRHEGGVMKLVALIVAPYRSEAHPIDIVGVDVALGRNAATGLALILHELSTNAAKYGALAHPDGRLAIAADTEGGILRIVWTETSAAATAGAPARVGFGTTMSERVAQGLRATLTRDWLPAGLTVTLRIPMEMLSA